MPTAEPLDLPLIRQWLGTLASVGNDSARGGKHHLLRKTAKPAQSHEDGVNALIDNLSGMLGGSPTEDILRRLLALGAVHYIRRIGRVPVDAKTEDVILDVTAFALWSVAQAPVLPSDWEEVLARLTSPRMADLVAQVRGVDAARRRENFAIFYGILASSPITQGARNLMADLSDPRRGGSALASLALAAGLPEPDPRQRNKAAIAWLFTALFSGALGAEGGHLADAIDRMAEDAWDLLTGGQDMHGHSGSHGGVLAEELIHGFFHH
jgi:hypothetical protein